MSMDAILEMPSRNSSTYENLQFGRSNRGPNNRRSHDKNSEDKKTDQAFLGNGDQLKLNEKLSFLLAYGDMFLAVTGKRGSGKSLLKSQAMQQLSLSHKVLDLSGGEMGQIDLIHWLILDSSLGHIDLENIDFSVVYSIIIYPFTLVFRELFNL